MGSVYKVMGQAVTSEETLTITNKEISSDVVTLTTSTDHLAVVGQPIQIEEADQQLSINNKEIDSNVATLTTSSNHRILTGQNVTVAGVDATFDGTHSVTSVTGNTFSYTLNESDVSYTSATGTVDYADLAFNGTFIVDSTPTTTTFTYDRASDDLSPTSASNFTATHIPWEVVYTCPSSTSAVISNITICNQTELPAKYQLAISDTLDLENKHLIFYNDTLDSFDTIQFTGGITLDDVNKYIMLAGDLENISISVFGAEVT